jgi:VIT1/CCC1 family predicted Fe2+/Mn2+ transporter
MAIRQRQEQVEWKSQIREVVFGMQDGLVSTVGFVAGLHGATSDNYVVLLGGVVQMVAGAFSMAAGAYLSTKAEEEVLQREVAAETERFEREPYLAQEALLDSLESEGLPRDRAYRVVALLADERHAFLETFREKVLGIGSATTRVPVWAASLMGLSFAVGAIIPLVPYFVLTGYASLAGAVALACLALFGIGVAKAIFAAQNWWRSGVEFLGIAMGAAIVGYLIGLLLPGG